jgi:hypothetical protein
MLRAPQDYGKASRGKSARRAPARLARAGDPSGIGPDDKRVAADDQALAGIADRAVEYLDRERPLVAVVQQVVDDLRPVRPVVAAVAEAGERTAAALEVGGADVIEHERAVGGCRRAKPRSIRACCQPGQSSAA